MDENKFQTILIKRLNTLISLVLDIASEEKAASITEKVSRLLELGLTPAEIAEVLGKQTNYVTAVIHRGKKRKTKGKKDE